MTNTLISIIGPTAIGKTALSIKLAQHFNTEIISADSRQFYKEMHIGTAVPSLSELNAAPHHFIQHKSITENYSVGDFEREAITKIESLQKANPITIMVGGSGLYVDAVTKGLDYFPDVDSKYRKQLNDQLENEGLEKLQMQLKKLDPKTYNTIALNNPHRIIRALEICLGSGKPYSSFVTSTNKKRSFNTITIGLDADRAVIYDRINQRVDVMIKEGLIDEAKSLYSHRHLNALNTVGYKELFRYFDGEITLEFAISEIKKNTRRFAKRQLTWFKKDKSIQWFNFTQDVQDVIAYIEKEVEKNPT